MALQELDGNLASGKFCDNLYNSTRTLVCPNMQIIFMYTPAKDNDP